MVIVAAAGEAPEDQVLIGEAVVDPDAGGILRTGRRYRQDQVRSDQRIDIRQVRARRHGEKSLRHRVILAGSILFAREMAAAAQVVEFVVRGS